MFYKVFTKGLNSRNNTGLGHPEAPLIVVLSRNHFLSIHIKEQVSQRGILVGWTELLQPKTHLALFSKLEFNIAFSIETVGEEQFLLAGNSWSWVILDDEEGVYLLIEFFLSEEEVASRDILVSVVIDGLSEVSRDLMQWASEIEVSTGISKIKIKFAINWDGFQEIEVLAASETDFVGGSEFGGDDAAEPRLIQWPINQILSNDLPVLLLYLGLLWVH